MRGGIPDSTRRREAIAAGTPYARGYTARPYLHIVMPSWNPVYAGVFPHHIPKPIATHWEPRIRGGIPFILLGMVTMAALVPVYAGVFTIVALVPVYAGVFTA